MFNAVVHTKLLDRVHNNQNVGFPGFSPVKIFAQTEIELYQNWS